MFAQIKRESYQFLFIVDKDPSSAHEPYIPQIIITEKSSNDSECSLCQRGRKNSRSLRSRRSHKLIINNDITLSPFVWT